MTNCEHEWRLVLGEKNVGVFYCIHCLAIATVQGEGVSVKVPIWENE